MQKKLILSIEGMHCGACVRRVTAALEVLRELKLGRLRLGRRGCDSIRYRQMRSRLWQPLIALVSLRRARSPDGSESHVED